MVFLVFIISSCLFDSRRMKRFQSDFDCKKCFSGGETLRIPVHLRKAPMVVLMGARNTWTLQTRKKHPHDRCLNGSEALPQWQRGHSFCDSSAIQNYRNSHSALARDDRYLYSDQDRRHSQSRQSRLQKSIFNYRPPSHGEQLSRQQNQRNRLFKRITR